MSRKKVVIIYDNMKFDKQMILDDMQSEGFQHRFKFADDVVVADELILYIEEADEVWTFGKVKHMASFILSEARGKEIWEMR